MASSSSSSLLLSLSLPSPPSSAAALGTVRLRLADAGAGGAGGAGGDAAGLVLLQADAHILAALAASASASASAAPVRVKGAPHEPAVLCTHERTYELKKAETSNTLLLVPEAELAVAVPALGLAQGTEGRGDGGDGGDGDSDAAGAGSLPTPTSLTLRRVPPWVIEAVRCPPRVAPLAEFLPEWTPRQHVDPEAEACVVGPPPRSFAELALLVQASDVELRAALAALNAFEDDGLWWVVSRAFRTRVFDDILDEVDSRDWPLERLSERACAEALRMPRERAVVARVLAPFALAPGRAAEDGGGGGDDDVVWALDRRKVAAFRAAQTLSDTKFVDRAPLWEEFLEDLFARLPSGVGRMQEADVAALLPAVPAVLDTGAVPPVVRKLAAPLAPLPRERARQLFALRARWTLDDIRPYLAELAPPGANFESFLLDFARLHRGEYVSRE